MVKKAPSKRNRQQAEYSKALNELRKDPYNSDKLQRVCGLIPSGPAKKIKEVPL